jgi:hypothetical protein
MAPIMAASSALAAGYNPGYYPIDSCGDRTMPTDIHCICKTGESHEPQADGSFASGKWRLSDELAEELVGGCIYLHEKQKAVAWHGGTIKFWHYAEDSGRKVFYYVVDGDYQIVRPENWAQEMAIVRR